MKLERERMDSELKIKGEFVPIARSEKDENQNDEEEVATCKVRSVRSY